MQLGMQQLMSEWREGEHLGSSITEEMLDFMGVLSATLVNYSCALIARLELTELDWAETCTHNMHEDNRLAVFNN